MDDQDYIQSITSLERIFHFFYTSASPNIHGKLLYINHQRPKGQLIEMMALAPWQYNCTLPNQFYAFEFPASAFFLVTYLVLVGLKRTITTV